MKLRYLIGPESDLTQDYICKAIMDFQTKSLPSLVRLGNYYAGKQKIIKKQPSSSFNPNNIAQVNYCNSIVKNYNGYLTGTPIAYSNDDFTEVIDILNYNDVQQEDTEYLKQALIYGRAFECCYIDEDGKQRFKLFNTKECLPIYANTIEEPLLYVIRFYREAPLENTVGMEDYIVEVYGPSRVDVYKSAPGFASLEFIESRPHYYNQCPVTVFSLNEEEESIFYQVMSLQDSYNTILSCGIDDYQAWADAYLVLTGANMDEDDMESFKANRFIQLPDSQAQVQYLTKNTSSTQLEYLLKTLDEQIHNISHCPNLNDEKFYSQSGISLKYKLVGFETEASTIENKMRMALQRRIELICSILHLTAEGEEQWRDVEITFKRNLPVDTDGEADFVNKLRGLVPDQLLLAQLSFIRDPKAAYEMMKQEEQDSVDMFEYGHNLEDSEGEQIH